MHFFPLISTQNHASLGNISMLLLQFLLLNLTLMYFAGLFEKTFKLFLGDWAHCVNMAHPDVWLCGTVFQNGQQ